VSDEVLRPMAGVRSEDSGVDLVRHWGTGRLVLRAYNEGGFNCTDIDLLDLLAWLTAENAAGRLPEELAAAVADMAEKHARRG